MKFKSVKISAFRIYEKPEDATFDFTIGDDKEPADFVSIFAPNGFGKTSFYDAVEWGITDNVQRFWQREDFTNKSIATQKRIQAKQIQLLRNTNAPTKLKTYVQITTDSEELPAKVLSTHGNRRMDLGECGDFKNEEFREVILSQEWISAFLKEVDGARRYELFMKNPTLKALDDYYRSLQGLISANEQQINLLVEDIGKQESKVLKVSEDDVFARLNTTIIQLKKLGEPFDQLSDATTDKEVLTFNDQVSRRLLLISKDLDTLAEQINEIELAETGNDSLMSLPIYFQEKERLKAINADLIALQRVLEKYKQSSDQEQLLAGLVLQQQQVINGLAYNRSVLRQFPGYENAFKAIAKLREQVGDDTKTLGTTLTQINDTTKQRDEVNKQIATIFIDKEHLRTQLAGLPTILAEQKELAAKISVNEKTEQGLEGSIKTKQEEIKAQQARMTLLKSIRIKATDVHYVEARQPEFAAVHPLLDAQEVRRAEIDTVNREISALQSRIDQQDTLNRDFLSFTQAGLKLITEIQSSDCPLCQHQYANFEELSERVSSNPLLTGTLQTMVNEMAALQQTRAQKMQERLVATDPIVRFFYDLEDKAIQELTTLQEALAILTESQRKSLAETAALRTRQQAIITQLDGLSEIAFRAMVTDRLNKLAADEQQAQQQMTAAQNSIPELEQKKAVLNAGLSNLKAQITEQENNQDFKDIIAWHNTSQVSGSIDKAVLIKELSDLEAEHKDITDRINSLRDGNELQKRELAGYEEADLRLRIKSTQETLDNLSKKLAVYESRIQKKLGIKESELGSEITLKQQFQILRERLEAERKKGQDIKQLLELLGQYQSNIMPFIQSEKARKAIQNSQAELNFLKTEVGPLLEKERNDIKADLEKRVRTFFYTGLINQIYNKIDPHPEFKEVEFQANFGSSAPTLDVLVTGSNQQKQVIPNLYFSAAQINILCLSIFLATALNSKKYDCIFIDDPIQSMDSINVLSTIDLLRSIVLNQKKQVILSTHDANFHNLIKKKMPTELFKSKYLELASFGKVKVDLQ